MGYIIPSKSFSICFQTQNSTFVESSISLDNRHSIQIAKSFFIGRHLPDNSSSFVSPYYSIPAIRLQNFNGRCRSVISIFLQQVHLNKTIQEVDFFSKIFQWPQYLFSPNDRLMIVDLT